MAFGCRSTVALLRFVGGPRFWLLLKSSPGSRFVDVQYTLHRTRVPHCQRQSALPQNVSLLLFISSSSFKFWAQTEHEQIFGSCRIA
eukprot:6196358-Pleurochrysis_carterae.AAC.2